MSQGLLVHTTLTRTVLADAPGKEPSVVPEVDKPRLHQQMMVMVNMLKTQKQPPRDVWLATWAQAGDRLWEQMCLVWKDMDQHVSEAAILDSKVEAANGGTGK